MKISTFIKSALLGASLFAAAISIPISSRAQSMEMFDPPNAQAKILGKYFNGNRNFIFCFLSYDVPQKKFKDEQFCIRKDVDKDRVFFELDKPIAKSDAPEVTLRYNTLDRGLVDKVYQIAPSSTSDKSVFIVNPEDRLDITNMLINSRDVVLFYKTDNTENYELMYYPLPVRNKDGTMPMVEAE